MTGKIILATTSPYRQAAFRTANLEFVAEGSNVEEYFPSRPTSPDELVTHLAKLKAEAVAKNHSEGIVIGCDSVGFFEGKILEKPKSTLEALQRLRALSGKNHQFKTGVYMLNISLAKTFGFVTTTDIQMRKISDVEIGNYLSQHKEFNTFALGYDPLDHYSSTFVKRIDGSYSNLIRGIPMEAIVEAIRDLEW